MRSDPDSVQLMEDTYTECAPGGFPEIRPPEDLDATSTSRKSLRREKPDFGEQRTIGKRARFVARSGYHTRQSLLPKYLLDVGERFLPTIRWPYPGDRDPLTYKRPEPEVLPRGREGIYTKDAAALGRVVESFIRNAHESLLLSLDMISPNGWSGQGLTESLRECAERRARIKFVTTAFVETDKESEYAAKLISDVSRYAAVFILTPPIPRISYAISDFKRALLTWRSQGNQYGCREPILGEASNQLLDTIVRFDRWRWERVVVAWALPKIEFIPLPRGVAFEWEVDDETADDRDYHLQQMKKKCFQYETSLRMTLDRIAADEVTYPRDLLEVEDILPSEYYPVP